MRITSRSCGIHWQKWTGCFFSGIHGSDAVVRFRTMVRTGLGPDRTDFRVQVCALPWTGPIVRFPVRWAQGYVERVLNMSEPQTECLLLSHHQVHLPAISVKTMTGQSPPPCEPTATRAQYYRRAPPSSVATTMSDRYSHGQMMLTSSSKVEVQTPARRFCLVHHLHLCRLVLHHHSRHSGPTVISFTRVQARELQSLIHQAPHSPPSRSHPHQAVDGHI